METYYSSSRPRNLAQRHEQLPDRHQKRPGAQGANRPPSHANSPPYNGAPKILSASPSAELADNNFRLLRILTALVVAATHCLWVVYGFEPDENNLLLSFLMQASHCGICIFFGLSGYLITQSLMTRPDFVHFTLSRILRLCPLIILSAFLMGFVAGPLLSTASFADYYGDWRLWAYVPLNAVTYSDLALPGLFEKAPAGSEINVSLWTLKYEVMGYLALGLAAFLGILKRGTIWIFALLAFALYGYVSYMTELRSEIAFMQHGLRFGFALLIGVLLFAYRDIIPLSIFGVISLVGLAYVTNSSAFMEPFRILALIYTAIWFGSKSSRSAFHLKPAGDYSYGIFVFHWPIAQIVLQLSPGIGYADLLLYVMPLTFLFAVICWYGIEKPFLSSRPWLTYFMKRRFTSLGTLPSTLGTLPSTLGELNSTLGELHRPGLLWGKRGFEVMTTYHEAEGPAGSKPPLNDGLHSGSFQQPGSFQQHPVPSNLPPSHRPQASGYTRRKR